MKKTQLKYVTIIIVGLMWIFLVIIPAREAYLKVEEKQEMIGESFVKVINNDIMVGDACIYRFVPVNGGFSLIGVGNKMGYIDECDTINTIEYFIHRSYICSFLIGETEVTQQLWDCVMIGEIQLNDRVYNQRPILYKPYKDWETFIHKLESMTGRKFRIPSNDEWEFAARGGNKSRGYKYAGSDSIEEVAFYKENTIRDYVQKGLYTVARKKPNELGLFDMSGSASEFTTTTIDELNPFSAELLNHANVLKSDRDTPMRISRGGSYNSDADKCVVSYGDDPGVSIEAGLRLILEY